jgi:hypothetical protein
MRNISPTGKTARKPLKSLRRCDNTYCDGNVQVFRSSLLLPFSEKRLLEELDWYGTRSNCQILMTLKTEMAE